MKKLSGKIIFLLTCIFLVACITDFKSNNLSFNSEQWKNGDLRLRGQMSKDLVESKILEGKTKDEVRNLLGEPFHSNSMPDETENWSYKTDEGLNFGEGVWIYWLNIDFSKQNRTVVKIYVTD